MQITNENGDSEPNFTKNVIKNNLPPLSDISYDVWQAGGKLICKSLFAGELINGEVTTNKLIREGYLQEEDSYNHDDIIGDILIATEKRSEITHYLDSLSYEIPLRTLADFPDNEEARKIMVNTLASIIDDTLEDENRIPSSKTYYKNIDEIMEYIEEIKDQMEDGTLTPHKPLKESIEMAERVISAMENKTKQLLPKKSPIIHRK